MYSNYSTPTTYAAFEPSAPIQSASESSVDNQQNQVWNRIRVNIPQDTTVDSKRNAVHPNVTVQSPILAQSFQNDYTNAPNNEENDRTKEFVLWKDEVFSSLFVTLTVGISLYSCCQRVTLF